MIECKLNEIERKKYKWRKKVFAQQLRKPHSKLHVQLYQREFTSNGIIKQHWVLKIIFHDKHDPLLSMGRWTINLAIPLFFLYMQRSPYIIAHGTYTIRTCYCGWREKNIHAITNRTKNYCKIGLKIVKISEKEITWYVFIFSPAVRTSMFVEIDLRRRDTMCHWQRKKMIWIHKYQKLKDCNIIRHSPRSQCVCVCVLCKMRRHQHESVYIFRVKAILSHIWNSFKSSI